MVAAAIERGDPLPEGLADETDLWDDLLPYWNAYSMLGAGRTWSGSAGGIIPNGLLYTEMVAYARDHDMAETLEDLDEFLTVMRAMDVVFMEHRAEKLKTTR